MYSRWSSVNWERGCPRLEHAARFPDTLFGVVDLHIKSGAITYFKKEGLMTFVPR